MWKVLILFVYLTIEALVVVSFENSHGNVKCAQIFGRGYNNVELYRLPNSTIPEIYSIDLRFGDFENGDLNFSGNVHIKINVLENTNMIVLHSSVSIIKTTLAKSDRNGIAVAHTHDVEGEFLIIHTTEEILQSGSILWLGIHYIGYINSFSEKGVFRKEYLDSNGDINYYIATQTRNNYARRISPLYDEPRFKALFIISLKTNLQYKAISNVKESVVIEYILDGYQMTIFNHVRSIPTYLIAFVICKFNATEYRTSNNFLLRIFSNSIKNQNTVFGFETTERALHMFENEFSFEIQYELDKLDQIALPFFTRCGIANYGVSFYRENCLLFERTINTVNEEESVALAIVNNVCHQIFDNHFTLLWWSSLWLPDGLCRFYEYHITSKIYSTLILDGLFVIDLMENALVSDSLSSTHPLSYYEEQPGDIFDTIIYNKSASIIRMIFHSLSETTFTKGLKIFLNESTLSPLSLTFQQHLYDAWQRAANQDNVMQGELKLEELFGCWEHQHGHPVLFVERSYNNHRVQFTQKHFTIQSKDSFGFLWNIPVTYATKSQSGDDLKSKFWIPQTRTYEILINDLHPSSYLLINVERMGFYRVQYDEANWMLISKELSRVDPSSNISPISRAMLMNDAAIFLINNMLRARIFLELMSHLEHDIQYIPWLAATKSLEYMRLMILDGNTKLSDDFKKFLQKLLIKVFITYGIEEKLGEPQYHKNIRNIAISWSCGVHLQLCLDATRDKLWKFMLNDENSSISVDHEYVIFCKGLIMATEHEFDFIWKVFKRTVNPTRRNLYLNSMGCIEDEVILMKFIMTIIESEDIDNVVNNEWESILKATYSNNAVGLRVTLRFLRKHYDAFIDLLLELNAMSSMNGILRDIANRINDNSLSATLSDLLVIYNINTSMKEEIQAIVSGNLRWFDTHSSDIQDFLDDFHNSAALSSTSTIIWYLVIAIIIFGFPH